MRSLLSQLMWGETMLFVELDKERRRSITNQIYTQLRKKIMHGELKSGERLPSSRELAKDLHVARNTVLTAFDMLVSEGLAVSVPGSGIYVSREAAELPLPETPQADHYTPSLAADRIPLNAVNFDSGIPALELFPRSKWNRFFSRAFLDAPISALGYDDPQGRPELRKTLAAYLEKSRGIHCDPDQIIITSGAKQGLTLIAKCLLDENSEVLLEDPSNANVRQIFSYHTNRILPVPVDGQGLVMKQLPSDGMPKLIFVTPSHQFPMGGILPIQRRLELIQYARRKGCWLLEDDYDSEFRYDGAPVRSLFELDDNRVIYVGTFSKIMFPSLRLGYLVLPHPLVEQCLTWKRLADHHSNSVYQLALTHFIESGEFEKHISRMKKIYYKRRCNLLALLEKYFPGQVRIYGDAAGMHVVAGFHEVVFTPELIRRIRNTGVYLVPVEKHSALGGHVDQVILGYAQLDPEEMEKGLIKIKNCIDWEKAHCE